METFNDFLNINEGKYGSGVLKAARIGYHTARYKRNMRRFHNPYYVENPEQADKYRKAADKHLNVLHRMLDKSGVYEGITAHAIRGIRGEHYLTKYHQNTVRASHPNITPKERQKYLDAAARYKQKYLDMIHTY